MALTEEKLKEHASLVVWDGMQFRDLLHFVIRAWALTIRDIPVSELVNRLDRAPQDIWEMFEYELTKGNHKKAIQKVRVEIE